LFWFRKGASLRRNQACRVVHRLSMR
jgi:hypothetical protein